MAGREPRAYGRLTPRRARQTFEEFLRYKFDLTRPWVYFFEASRQIQAHYIMDQNGRLLVDYIGRFERLHEDFMEASRLGGIPQIKLPHKRHSRERKKDYRTYYDDVTAELVANHYAEDIELFGYSFDDFDRELEPIGRLDPAVGL